MEIIELKGLSKDFGKVKALDNINLKVKKGAIFGIIGPSGAGKSTLIRSINLLEKPSKGQILLKGEDLTTLSSRELRQRRRKIGMIFQHFNLLANRTVRGNISFPLEVAGLSKKAREKKVDYLVELVGLKNRENHYPAQLSGGQKQRVGIARALANDPEILLSDEATSSLDPEATAAVLKLLARIREELQLTILLITHEMEVIKEICDEVAVLEKGRIIEQGRVIDLFARPQKELTRRFIKTIIDFALPEELLKIQQQGLLLRVSFIGNSTHQPIISSLVKSFHLDANILYGKIDHIQGVPFGTLILKLEGEEKQLRKGVNFLREKDLALEVLQDGELGSL